jgi:tyrosyl-tRNA synthetase
MANNAEWLKTTGLLEFLRDVGKHFSINYMLQKDSVKSRLDSGISFTEFSYMLVQAYDFAHLYQTAQCELQMGGSDQWGNITAGIELIGKRYGGSAHGLVLPLLTTASGAKFGKSESGNVWLDPAKTSPYKFYQFWLNTEDADVERLFKTFTFRPLAEIAEIAAAHARDPGKRTAQRELARDLTIRVHGADTVGRVVAASDFLFGHADLHSLEPGAFDVVAGEVPTAVVERAGLDNLSVVDAFTSVGLASSKADARRNIQGNGFSINGERVTGADQVLGTGQLLAGRWIVLQKGKRNFALLDVR